MTVSNSGFQITLNSDVLDRFEGQIIESIQDPDKAGMIRYVYERQAQDLINTSDKFASEEFFQWVITLSKFLGSSAINHIHYARKTFPPTLSTHVFPNPKKITDREQALDRFFKELVKEWRMAFKINLPQVPASSQKVITILYRSLCGHGHLHAAHGIKQFLEERNYKIVLIDGGENENLIGERVRVEYRAALCTLRDELHKLKPDLIISTVAHHANWTQVAYDLLVPTLVIHTDYEFNDAIRTYNCDNSALIQYCLPHTYFDKNRKKIKERIPAPYYQTLVKEVGFPIRASFKREEDPTKIEELRKQYDIKDQERVVLMLGHEEPDTSNMILLIKQLQSSACSFVSPLCIVAVCRDVAKLAKALQNMPSHKQIRIKVESFLSEERMADYMKMASRCSSEPGLMVTKRGGSTVAEMVEMGVYAICLPTDDSEACNGDYLKRCNLGVDLDQATFAEQVVQAIEWKPGSGSIKRPLDWKTNLLALVEEKIDQCARARLENFDFSKANKF